MSSRRLGDLLAVISEQLVSSEIDQDLLIAKLSLNSKDTSVPKPEGGTLFFALSGTKIDGRNFIESAIAEGAVAVVANAEGYVGKNHPQLILVKDSVCCLSKITEEFYGQITSRIKTIGVTGTNGKTSVAWILSQMLSILEGKTAYVGTIGLKCFDNNQITFSADSSVTTPDRISLSKFLSDCLDIKACVMEASSHGIEQGRLGAINFDSAIFTNLTRDHLDYHETFEAYGLAKQGLFTNLLVKSCKKRKTAIVNADDDYGLKLKKALDCDYSELRTVTHSAEGKVSSDIFLVSSKKTLFGSQLSLNIAGKTIELETKLVGDYNLINTVTVFQTLYEMGYEISKIVSAFKEVNVVTGRLELVADTEPAVFVDYAHTPDALMRAQESLKELTKGRLITVFGCGGDRDRGKRPLMGEAVSKIADYSIITSDNPRTEEPSAIIQDILPGYLKESAGKFEVVENRKEAIFRAIELAKPEDAILVAGKGHEDYQEIQSVKCPFSDREVCLEALEKIKS